MIYSNTTKSANYTDWQWNAKKDGTIFNYYSSSNDFTVLVNLTMETKDLEFFILPTSLVKQWLEQEHNLWLNTPGKNNRPHSATNRKRHLSYTEHEDDLVKYKNWNIFWQ